MIWEALQAGGMVGSLILWWVSVRELRRHKRAIDQLWVRDDSLHAKWLKQTRMVSQLENGLASILTSAGLEQDETGAWREPPPKGFDRKYTPKQEGRKRDG